MRKTISLFLTAVMLILLVGCTESPKEQKRIEQPLFGTILADDDFFSAKEKMIAEDLTGLRFYAANSTDVIIEDIADVLNIWELLEKVSAGNAVDEPQIDDGLIVFDFLFNDGSDYTICFLTSEYVYGDNSVYEINNPDSVIAAEKAVRDAEEQ